jgi:hypothetical protein
VKTALSIAALIATTVATVSAMRAHSQVRECISITEAVASQRDEAIDLVQQVGVQRNAALSAATECVRVATFWRARCGP